MSDENRTPMGTPYQIAMIHNPYSQNYDDTLVLRQCTPAGEAGSASPVASTPAGKSGGLFSTPSTGQHSCSQTNSAAKRLDMDATPESRVTAAASNSASSSKSSSFQRRKGTRTSTQNRVSLTAALPTTPSQNTAFTPKVLYNRFQTSTPSVASVGRSSRGSVTMTPYQEPLPAPPFHGGSFYDGGAISISRNGSSAELDTTASFSRGHVSWAFMSVEDAIESPAGSGVLTPGTPSPHHSRAPPYLRGNVPNLSSPSVPSLCAPPLQSIRPSSAQCFSLGNSGNPINPMWCWTPVGTPQSPYASTAFKPVPLQKLLLEKIPRRLVDLSKASIDAGELKSLGLAQIPLIKAIEKLQDYYMYFTKENHVRICVDLRALDAKVCAEISESLVHHLQDIQGATSSGSSTVLALARCFISDAVAITNKYEHETVTAILESKQLTVDHVILHEACSHRTQDPFGLLPWLSRYVEHCSKRTQTKMMLNEFYTDFVKIRDDKKCNFTDANGNAKYGDLIRAIRGLPTTATLPHVFFRSTNAWSH